jgi:hypothetical protein
MFIRVILSAVIYLAVFGTVGFADEVTCNSGARYEDNLDGTVFDCKSGLVWLKDANCMESSGGIDKESNGTLTWHKARKWAAGLNSGTIVIPGLCGLNDGGERKITSTNAVYESCADRRVRNSTVSIRLYNRMYIQ